MGGFKIGDIAIAAFWVAGIFVLVRPGSQGPKLVEGATNSVVNLVKASTGGGTW